MSNQNTFTLELKQDEFEKVKDSLLALNWAEEFDSSQYVVFRLRSPQGSIAIMYFSGKLVFQGKEDFTSVISTFKQEESSEDNEFKPHMGVDEVGKGDYFGPLVVVSCFVTEEFYKKVKILGFGDSKKFSDKRISKLFDTVKDYPYYYSSIVHPKEYNKMTIKYKNASLLLAKQHSIVIENGIKDLESKGIVCNHIVIDQFSSAKSRITNELGEYGRKYEVVQYHKGESDVAVACASVIARGIFVKEWEKMNKEYDFVFPKGASNVIDNAKLFVSRYGKKELEKVAKVSFKTTKDVLG